MTTMIQSTKGATAMPMRARVFIDPATNMPGVPVFLGGECPVCRYADSPCAIHTAQGWIVQGAPEPFLKSTVRQSASLPNGYIDSETIISYTDNAAWITCKYVNHTLRFWSLPTYKLMRGWVDSDLARSGLKRDGRITLIQEDINGARYLVSLVPSA